MNSTKIMRKHSFIFYSYSDFCICCLKRVNLRILVSKFHIQKRAASGKNESSFKNKRDIISILFKHVPKTEHVFDKETLKMEGRDTIKINIRRSLKNIELLRG